MKMAIRVLSVLGSAVLVLLGAIMAFINLRILLAGEFLLANNPAASFFFYFFRVMVFLFFVYTGLIEFFRHKNDKAMIVSSVSSVICIVFSLVMFLGYEWYFALLFLVGSIITSLQLLPIKMK
ncbi:MAG: hypothetical protein K6B65_05400 [Bacilli bacterium]|nr:hypothetical protein [Bacilli bacterium]